MENLPALDPNLLWLLLPVILLVVVIPAVFFCIITYRALARCAPSARTMTPGLVWVGLIPLVGLVWQFRVVRAVATSLHNEFVRRGMPVDSAPGKGLGTAYATLTLLSVVPLVNFVTTLPASLCWALYCIRIALLTRGLDESAAVVPR